MYKVINHSNVIAMSVLIFNVFSSTISQNEIPKNLELLRNVIY